MITRVKLSTIEQGLPKYRSMLAGNQAYIGPAYDSIASATGTGSSGTITFSSIPQGYKHLQIRGIARTTEATTINDYIITFNNVTTSSYAYHLLQGQGGVGVVTGGAATQTSGSVYKATTAASTTANIMGVCIIDIPEYASTTKNKVAQIFSGTNTGANGYSIVSSSLLISTSAVTSVELKTVAGNWTTQTTFALYGIKGS